MGFSLSHTETADDEELVDTPDTPSVGGEQPTSPATEEGEEHLAEVRQLPSTTRTTTEVAVPDETRPTIAGEAKASAAQTREHIKHHNHWNLRPPSLRDMSTRIQRDEAIEMIPLVTMVRRGLDRVGLVINAVAYLFAWTHRRAGRLLVALPVDAFMLVTLVRVTREGFSVLPFID